MIEWQNRGWKWSFWKRVLDYAQEQCRKHWMFGGRSQDRQCPHCNTWASTVGGFSTTPDTDGFTDTMHCLQCGKPSRWCNEGGFLLVMERD
jgi:hypothetical protein